MMRNNFFGSVALLLSIGLMVGYVHPLWTGRIAETQAAIASSNDALEAVRVYIARQNELLAQKNAMDPAQLVRLTTFLPDSVDNVRLILALNALAARSGVSLSNVDVAQSAVTSGGSDANSDNPVGSIDLSVSATGTYSSFSKFLDGVEKSQRLLDVRDLTVTSAANGVYTYKMTIRIYWLR